MVDEQFDRVQQLFLTALELSEQERESWLIEQCGDDQALFEEVTSLLDHDDPEFDPLESPAAIPDHAIGLEETLAARDGPAAKPSDTEFEVDDGEDDRFLWRLGRIGVLSDEEISAIEADLSGGDPSSSAQQVASHLVDEGKITKYQAAALLRGRPQLLIDKYLILDLIGSGGMGMVFKAIHRFMNRVVAVKMISSHLVASPSQIQRFRREVRVAATLENVNIVRAYDADQSEGVHFLVMEYVRGENLRKIVQREGPMNVERALDCICQASRGLHYAHRRGVVHRDIKPGNLMQTRDRLVKVLDLGLADIDESLRPVPQQPVPHEEKAVVRRLAKNYHTEFGAVLGTAAFMAPEQSRHAASADNRSDIYSLGCTLFYLLTGKPPYHAETNSEVLAQHRESDVPSVLSHRADIPPRVEELVRRMLAKDPGDRFQSMEEVTSAITDCGIT